MKLRKAGGSWSRFIMIAVLTAAGVRADYLWVSGGLENFESSTLLGNTLASMAAQEKKIDEIGITTQGEWVIVAGTQVVASPGFPAMPLGKIQAFLAAGKTIDVVSFAPGGGWIVIAEDVYWKSFGLPKPYELSEQVEDQIAAGRRIQEVAFSPDSDGWTLVAGEYSHSESMPEDLRAAIEDHKASKRQVQGISTSPTGSWVVYADQWSAVQQAPNALASVLRNRAMNADRINHVRLGPSGGFVLYSHGKMGLLVGNDVSKLRNMETSLSAGKTIWKRMDELKVRGASVAVVLDNKVLAARSYGVREWGTEKPVLATTPFAYAWQWKR